jgi:hypothetical protein
MIGAQQSDQVGVNILKSHLVLGMIHLLVSCEFFNVAEMKELQ